MQKKISTKTIAAAIMGSTTVVIIDSFFSLGEGKEPIDISMSVSRKLNSKK